MPRREPLAERKPHVFEIAAGAVNEDERWRAGIGTEFDDMLAQAADVDETAARRMRALDQPRADKRDHGAGAEDRRGDGERVVHSGLDGLPSEPARALRVERVEIRTFEAGHVGLYLVADLGLQISEMAVAFRETASADPGRARAWPPDRPGRAGPSHRPAGATQGPSGRRASRRNRRSGRCRPRRRSRRRPARAARSSSWSAQPRGCRRRRSRCRRENAGCARRASSPRHCL